MEPRPDDDAPPRSRFLADADPLALVSVALGLAGIIGGISAPILLWALPMAFGLAAAALGLVSLLRTPWQATLAAVGLGSGLVALGVAYLAYNQVPHFG